MENRDTKIEKEGMQNLVAIFKLLFEMDRKQNPENYKKPSKSIGNMPDKQGDNKASAPSKTQGYSGG